jgi:hypothetical protein
VKDFSKQEILEMVDALMGAIEFFRESHDSLYPRKDNWHENLVNRQLLHTILEDVYIIPGQSTNSRLSLLRDKLKENQKNLIPAGTTGYPSEAHSNQICVIIIRKFLDESGKKMTISG